MFVTSRILVVDMLRGHCPVDKVAGLLVFNAHRCVCVCVCVCAVHACACVCV